MARLPGPGRALRLLTGRSWPQLASLIGGSGQGRGQGGAGAGRGRVLTERAGGGERSRAERLPGRGCGRRGACGSPDGAEPAGGRAARGGRRRAVPSLAGWPLQGRACQLPSPPRRRRGPSAVRGRRAARDTKGARAAGAGLRRRPARPDGPTLSLAIMAAAAAKSHHSCPTLCGPIDGSPPGFPIPRILQARTLEWAAISFSIA